MVKRLGHTAARIAGISSNPLSIRHNMQTRVHLYISGRVQGVCFRHYCTQVARRHGLSGWVRNRSDGSVEVVAEGERAGLEILAAWCRHGPPGALVQACRETYGEPTGEFDAFETVF